MKKARGPTDAQVALAVDAVVARIKDNQAEGRPWSAGLQLLIDLAKAWGAKRVTNKLIERAYAYAWNE